MSEDKTPLIEAISKLELAPGDILVVRLPREPTVPIAESARRYVSNIVGPDVKILLLGPNVELSTLTRKEIEERTI